MKNEVKSKVRVHYFRRLKLLLKSKLNAGNLFLGINSWAVAIVRYSAALIDWNKEEIDDMDRKTRNLLRIYKALHKKSNINRLYMKRKEGGRGLISIRSCVDNEIRSLNEYIANSDEELLMFAADTLDLNANNIETKDDFQKRLAREKAAELKAMKLHGQFENDTKEVKVKESWNWLRDGQLKRETEALIMAAQEQALNTNSIKKHIYKTGESDLCRLCSKNVENVTHILIPLSDKRK